jgi:transposase
VVVQSHHDIAEWTGRFKLHSIYAAQVRRMPSNSGDAGWAAWRAVWGAQRGNLRARYRYLVGREQNMLTPTQAQTVIAAAILRHLHAVITIG